MLRSHVTASSTPVVTAAQSRSRALQIAVIGSGPAGFYSAYRLFKKIRADDVRVTMFESLPVPFGLARYGIAPDHEEVKNCTETLRTLAHENPSSFVFAGNTRIGNEAGQLPLSSITPHFDAVLFAYGASKDRRLGIPGEELKRVLSARSFVGWYNGLPEHSTLDPPLAEGDTAVVIGQGNVALDVTRILLKSVEALQQTDISEEALDTLARSKVRNVKVVGRRGPLQAPYTIRELRELMHMPGLGFKEPPEPWDELIGISPRKKLPRQLRRIAEVLEKGSNTRREESDRAWQLAYLRSPAAFLSRDGEDLEAVGFEATQYAQPPADVLTGDPQADLNALRALRVRSNPVQKTIIHTKLAFRSVGYLSIPLPGLSEVGVPFDERLGIIPCDRWGRVLSPDEGIKTGEGAALTAGAVPGMYCAGWVKRGPTGVIASTMDDAFLTADIVAKDWAQSTKFIADGGDSHADGRGTKQGWEGVRREVEKRGIRSVGWSEWEKIDAEERRRGKEAGRPVRVKITSVPEMLKVLDG